MTTMGVWPLNETNFLPATCQQHGSFRVIAANAALFAS